MLHFLRRHPIPITAHFRHSLVLTYAFRRAALEPLLPPGLILDAHGDFGFVAIALVQALSLRPSFCPRFLGANFILTGYRIFARYRTAAGRTLRGLRILRSDTNKKTMAQFGNLLTNYHYRLARINLAEAGPCLEANIETPNAEADLNVIANLAVAPVLPEGSPFASLQQARLFAGPLPFTFDYEPETHSIVMIEGVREHWKPRPVAVCVRKATFFDHPPFGNEKPILANAFYVGNIPYHWGRGVREPLPNL
ncbi:MAG: hypothetical protein FJ403_07035 [Verrucomicrobia bacterium]|nr:hypothetical protein [Verrucomicrobiota bacterium]